MLSARVMDLSVGASWTSAGSGIARSCDKLIEDRDKPAACGASAPDERLRIGEKAAEASMRSPPSRTACVTTVGTGATVALPTTVEAVSLPLSSPARSGPTAVAALLILARVTVVTDKLYKPALTGDFAARPWAPMTQRHHQCDLQW
jgi:hypothetical protein